MLTIEDLHERSEEITARLDAIFEEIVDGKRFTLTMETAAEIVNLLLEAKKLGKSINYHGILVSDRCSGPH